MLQKPVAMKFIASLFGLFLTFSVAAQSKEGNFHLDKEYTINPKGTVDITCSDAKVLITGSSRTNAHIKIDREVNTKGLTFGHDDFRVDVLEQNGDLEIRERSSSVSIGVVGYYYEKYNITIEVPEGTSLTIKGDDGDYRIKNIDGIISLRLDDADVEMTQCSGNKFKIRLDDGDLHMDEGKGSLELEGDDADIEIKNANFTFVDARTDDGDLVIETSLAENGEYRIDAQDGLVSFSVTKGGGKFDISHDEGRITTEGEFSTVEDSENRTLLTLASGSAKVDIRADDARVRLIKR
jgi:hypothetical protein